MNVKTIIFLASAFVGGAAIGVAVGYFVGKKSATKTIANKETKEEVKEETKEEITEQAKEIPTYAEVISELEYRAAAEDEEFTEEDQEELESLRIADELKRYKAERENLIEEISEDMYYSDSDETGDLILGYDHEELYFFEKQEVLITDLGELKYPIDHYVGNILYEDNEEDKIKYYIRNHIEEMNYLVKRRDDYVEEYFPDLEY